MMDPDKAWAMFMAGLLSDGRPANTTMAEKIKDQAENADLALHEYRIRFDPLYAQWQKDLP